MNTPDKIERRVDIPCELDGNNTDGYMDGNLDDIDDVSKWVSEAALRSRRHRVFADFEVYDEIDGGMRHEREVSLVVARHGSYPQHTHRASDALFVVIDGHAVVLSGDLRFDAVAGTRIKVPRGTPHGFEIREGDVFKFVSIQHPPIRNHRTGEEDFHLLELV